MTLVPGSDPLFANLQIEGSALLSEQEIVNEVNSAFLQPMESFQRLKSLIPSHSEDLSPLTLPELAVLSALKWLNPKRAAGPDGAPNWLLKEYADILACPVTAVLASSLAEQRRPSSLKMAHVTDINKHLRPISTCIGLCRRSPRRPCGSGGD